MSVLELANAGVLGNTIHGDCLGALLCYLGEFHHFGFWASCIVVVFYGTGQHPAVFLIIYNSVLEEYITSQPRKTEHCSGGMLQRMALEEYITVLVFGRLFFLNHP